jgi:hypothetical protein
VYILIYLYAECFETDLRGKIAEAERSGVPVVRQTQFELWVVGGKDRVTGRCFMRALWRGRAARNTATVLPHIIEMVEPGTTLVSFG